MKYKEILGSIWMPTIIHVSLSFLYLCILFGGMHGFASLFKSICIGDVNIVLPAIVFFASFTIIPLFICYILLHIIKEKPLKELKNPDGVV